jgi:hypothetical protein
MSDIVVTRVEDVFLVEVFRQRSPAPGFDARRVEDRLCLDAVEAKTLYSSLGEVLHQDDAEECKLLRRQLSEASMEHAALIQRQNDAHAWERSRSKESIDRLEQAVNRNCADANFYRSAYERLRTAVQSLAAGTENVVKPGRAP